jgi:hypothetical protein
MAFPRTVHLKNRIVAFWKYCLSFRKHDWELSDYPVAIREHKFNPDYSSPRFTQHRYVACIINWAVTGGGETPQEAVSDLQNKFQSIKSAWKLEERFLLRPGTVGPLEFASQERVKANQDLSEEFIRRVLNLDWAWISDESSLWAFILTKPMRCSTHKSWKSMASMCQISNLRNYRKFLDRISTSQKPAQLRRRESL